MPDPGVPAMAEATIKTDPDFIWSVVDLLRVEWRIVRHKSGGFPVTKVAD